MSEAVTFWEAVKHICEKDARFKPEAYGFVMESLEFTIQGLDKRRHISATELLHGLSQHAKNKYGLLAHTVLADWGIQTGKDVGKIVYHLVEAGQLTKQAEDRYEDFEQDFDFEKILERDYFK
ncbi:MAG: hypothetical protein JSW50_04015 [Candidatus Latescibacterota bacterium]|nr:MAG: hypothetical protein JSW50_04015 [Candidatus Latescibacterota bacterium]